MIEPLTMVVISMGFVWNATGFDLCSPGIEKPILLSRF